MKIKLKESDHGFMTSFESLFQKHEQMRHPLDQNEYDIEIEIFNDSSYFMDQNQPPFYDVYFDDDYVGNDRINNDNDDVDVVINDFLIDKLVFECKSDLAKKKIINLSYVNLFYYKFTIDTKIDLFKGYMYITRVDE